MPLISNTIEEYHSSAGFSKSQLHAYATKTPYAAKFGKRKDSNAFDVGHAAHTAILEPHLLEASVFKATAKRRGTEEWKDNQAEAEGRILLKAEDYELVMLLRDLADTVPELVTMRDGAMIEQSCYARDEETGAVIRCRPDIYSPSLAMMADIKNMADISDDAWSRDVGKFGYHMQHAMYQDVWNKGSDGLECEAFFFICFSKTEPPEVVCRELEPVDIEEGFLAYRAALKLAVECETAQHWPSLPTGVVRGVKMRDRDRRHTPSQWKIDNAVVETGDEYE
jgi:hypothetical protein